MAKKNWSRVVWMESDNEEEEVIPSSWIVNKKVYWPRVSNLAAKKAMREKWTPIDAFCSWDQFDLVKVKFSSDNKQECEDHNITTAAEEEDQEEEEEVEGRRKSRKKNFGSDFQTDYSSGKNAETAKKSLPKDSNLAGQKTMKGMPTPPPPPPPPATSSSHTVAADVHRDQGSRKASDVPKKSQSLNACNRKASEVAKSPQPRSQSPQSPRSPTPPRLLRSLSRSQTPVVHSQRSRSSRSRSQTSEGTIRNKRRRQRSRSSLRHWRNDRSGSRSQERRRRSRSQERRRRSRSQERRRRSRSQERRRRSRSQERRHRSISQERRHRSRSSSRSSRRFVGSAPRTRSGENNHRTPVFPMPEERFQRRSMYLLVEIRDLLKKFKNPVANFAIDEPILQIEQQENLEDLKVFDLTLDDKREYALYRATVAKIGGCDYGDHIKKSMQRLMTNKTMASMNMSGKRGKYAFGESNIYKLLKDVIMKTYGVTEQQVAQKTTNFLKWAPERQGGGGRKK